MKNESDDGAILIRADDLHAARQVSRYFECVVQVVMHREARRETPELCAAAWEAAALLMEMPDDLRRDALSVSRRFIRLPRRIEWDGWMAVPPSMMYGKQYLVPELPWRTDNERRTFRATEEVARACRAYIAVNADMRALPECSKRLDPFGGVHGSMKVTARRINKSTTTVLGALNRAYGAMRSPS